MKFPRRALSVLVIVAQTFATIEHARAEDVESHPRGESIRSATLVYVAPSGRQCPDESSFRDRVGARLGVDPFVEKSSTSMFVEIRARASALVGIVELRQAGTAPRTREIETREGCESLVSALAATVALALDPMGEAARATQSAAGASTSLATTSSPRPRSEQSDPESPQGNALKEDRPASAPQGNALKEDRPASAPPGPPGPSQRIVPFVAVGVEPGVGLAPSATVGAELGVGLRRGALALLLQARVDTLPSAVTLASASDVELTLVGLGLVPCGILGRFRLCGVLRAGFAQGRASETDRTAPAGSAFAAVAARPGILVPVASFVALSAEVEFGAMLARTQLIVNGRDVWTAPPVFASGILGLVVSFGDGL